MEDGYEFFGEMGLVTVFSAPNYCNEFDNDGAMLVIEDDLCCSFLKLQPAEKNQPKPEWTIGGKGKKGKRF